MIYSLKLLFEATTPISLTEEKEKYQEALARVGSQ